MASDFEHNQDIEFQKWCEFVVDKHVYHNISETIEYFIEHDIDIFYDTVWEAIPLGEDVDEITKGVRGWWAVDDYLARKLRVEGELVLENILDFDFVWGRTANNSFIAQDNVIRKIAVKEYSLGGKK